ncbi:hypothetical protein FKP32DRAFT_333676 [Trametes sanguinea]|nr:hypothetical protein FKP32DRAFT_333676 [Trametes sanguinea]
MNNLNPSDMLPPELARVLTAIGSSAGSPLVQMQAQPGAAAGQFAPMSSVGMPTQMSFPTLPTPNNASTQWQSNLVQYLQQYPQPPTASGSSSYSTFALPQVQSQSQSPQQNQQLAWMQQPEGVNQPVGAPAGLGPVDPLNHIAALIPMLQTYLAQQQTANQQQHPHPQPQPQPSPQPQAEPEPQLRPRSQSHTQPSLPPVGPSTEDEDLIVRALKHRTARGITPRQALERLDGVNGYSASAWKDYFLEHLDRLYARATPKAAPKGDTRDGSASKSSLFSQGMSSTPPPLSQQRPVIPRFANRAQPAEVVAPVPSKTHGKYTSPSAVPPEYARISPEREITANTTSAARRKRGGTIPLFHAGVLVPNSPVQLKPRPPPSDETDGAKFTDAEKIFFIQYIQWRIRNKPTISKFELYEELAAQVPRHDVEAWKRHWDKYPEVADQVYIEGRNRAHSASQRSSSTTAVSELSQARPAEPSEDEPNKSVRPPDDDSDDEDDNYDEDGEEPSGKPDVVPVSHRKKSRRGRPWQRVTENDLRTMAQYMAERYSPAWRNTTRTARWQEFADRPENSKRTVSGWMMIESTHNEKLRKYVSEYRCMHPNSSVTTTQSEDDSLQSLSDDPNGATMLAEKAKAVELQGRTIPLPRHNLRPIEEGEAIAPVEKVEPKDIPLSELTSTNDSALAIPQKRAVEDNADASGWTHKRSKPSPRAGDYEVVVLSD